MNKILEIKFGSHLYGTNTESSDLDIKAIYLPTAREIVLNSYKRTISTTRPKRHLERNTKDDVDIEVFSLDRYLQLLVEGQTVALDMLFSNKSDYTYESESSWIMQHIYTNRHEVLNRNVNSFVGYTKVQAAKYGVKGFRVHALKATLEMLNKWNEYDSLNEEFLKTWISTVGNEHIKITLCRGPNGIWAPHLEVCNKKYPLHATVKYIKQQVQRRYDEYGARAIKAESNEGLDWKALSHSVRVASEARELLETGKITFPCPNKQLLLDIKLGKMPYSEVANIIEQGLVQLEESQKKSILKDAPNQKWVDDFICEIYTNIVRNG